MFFFFLTCCFVQKEHDRTCGSGIKPSVMLQRELISPGIPSQVSVLLLAPPASFHVLRALSRTCEVQRSTASCWTRSTEPTPGKSSQASRVVCMDSRRGSGFLFVWLLPLHPFFSFRDLKKEEHLSSKNKVEILKNEPDFVRDWLGSPYCSHIHTLHSGWSDVTEIPFVLDNLLRARRARDRIIQTASFFFFFPVFLSASNGM